MAIQDELLQQAVAMMKAGQPPEWAYAHLMSRGVPEEEARRAIGELVELKRRADASDPNRLREEARWMLLHGASIEDAVKKLEAAGIAPEHARPEVERLAEGVRKLAPCQRCYAPTPPKSMFYDARGMSVCARCHATDELGAAQRRIVETDLETVGLGSYAATALSDSMAPPTPMVPLCRWCWVPGTPVALLHPEVRSQLHPGWAYACANCRQGVA